MGIFDFSPTLFWEFFDIYASYIAKRSKRSKRNTERTKLFHQVPFERKHRPEK